MNGFKSILSTITLLWFSTSFSATEPQNRPNILFFLADDWGFNDLGYYENTDTSTPFIQSLVQSESLRIDRHYVLPECTITRCALLTGRHPMRYGMQDGILQFGSNYALSRHETLISNEFQSQGYSTYLVGKWHVGMRNPDYTPTHRGFDSFLGFLGGLEGYYNHYGQNKYYKKAIDFKWDENDYHENGVYTLDTFSNRINDILNQESQKRLNNKNNVEEETDTTTATKPFFLYVGWQGSHSPSEAPEEYAKQYKHVKSKSRQYFQAQTTYTDDALEVIVNNLKTNGLWDNTLIIVASDNGGSFDYGDNAPLRGGKFTIWEGGIRVPAFITGGYLPESLRGGVLDQFPVHVTDWYKTLLSAAGLQTTSPNNIDGEDLWSLIMKSNILDSNGNIKNKINEKTDEYNELIEMKENLIDNRYILVNVDNNECGNDVCGAIIYGGRYKLLITDNQIAQVNMDNTAFWLRNFAKSQHKDKLGCGMIPDNVNKKKTKCKNEICLFDLKEDPCEYYDISENNPELTENMLNKLKEYYNEQVTPLHLLFEDVDKSIYDPSQTGFWSPWDNREWFEVEFEQYLDEFYNDNAKIENNDKNNNVIEKVIEDNMESNIEENEKEEFKEVSMVFNHNYNKMIIILGLGFIVLCSLMLVIAIRNPNGRFYKIVNYEIDGDVERGLKNNERKIINNYDSVSR